MIFFHLLGSAFTWLIGGLYFLIWMVLIIILSFILPIRIYDPLVKQGSKLLLKIAGVKVRVKGLENIKPDRRYVFMANHTNIFDSFVIYSSFPHVGRGIEKSSHFWWPFYGWALWAIQMIPIPSDRGVGRGRKVYEALDKAAEWLKRHKDLSVVYLPEGTRTEDGQLGKFKRGGFLLAIKAKIPVCPMTINGLFNIQQKGRFLLRPGVVDVVIHEPISTEEMDKADSSVLMQRVRDVISSAHCLEVKQA